MSLADHIRKVLWGTVVETFNTGCFGYAKEAAYSMILSFFPMLLFAAALFAVIGQDYMGEILKSLQRVMPPEGFTLIANFLTEFFKDQPPRSLFWIAAISTIIPASGLMGTFSKAFDHIYANTTTRSVWMSQVVAYTLVFIIGVPLLVATVATAAGTNFEHTITRWIGDRQFFGIAWKIGRWSILQVTVMLIAMLLYLVAPSRRPAWRHIIPGAFLATVLWTLATLGFGVYVANFDSYNRVYGSLGAGMVLLVWMYLTSLALMIGAVFNRQCEIHFAHPVRPEAAAPTSV